MTWPPALDELKTDMGIGAQDVRDDERLQQVLDAAVSFVQRVRPEFNYDADPVPDDPETPEPTPDLVLGTLRLASRWHTRRRSPDALIAMGQEMGQSRVPSFDSDIERLLGIGRHGKFVFG